MKTLTLLCGALLLAACGDDARRFEETPRPVPEKCIETVAGECAPVPRAD